MQYKIGDKVEIIGNYNFLMPHTMPIGRQCIVMEVGETVEWCNLEEVGKPNRRQWVSSNDFRLIEPYTPSRCPSHAEGWEG